jgi:ATP-dependent helicase/nuclease subunit A
VNVAARDQTALLDRTLAVLEDPNFVLLFGPQSRAEVAIVAELPRTGAPPAPFAGRIDRLAIAPDHIAIADFKSGAPGPNNETPPDYVLQLALYRQALGPLYPDYPVRTYIVWIDAPQAVEITSEALDAALARRSHQGE